jgi:hypothetical protein
MLTSEKKPERNPIQKLAQGAIEKPGIYLIALRAHLNRGKTIIRDVFDSVTEVIPSSAKAGNTDQT